MSAPEPLDPSQLNLCDDSVGDPSPVPFDPLRLCVFTTVALLTCVFGPLSLLAFAITAIIGYAKARGAGLMRSRCKLRDTRLVLGYLTFLAVAAAVAIPFWVMLWARVLG
ncbi:MAG: hypothetical protein FWD74_07785 [Actinomycetia bacterium]|nr:hypothetical protein [Actinomycetes bacterium]